MPRNKKKYSKPTIKDKKFVEDPVSIEFCKNVKKNDLMKDDFDIEFEISFINEISDQYYDLLLVYHDTKYYLSVDSELYTKLPNIFTEYPEILKKSISDNCKNIDFFTIQFDDSNIICSCSIDLKLIVKKIDLLFVYKDVTTKDMITHISSKLSRARFQIKQLQKKIDDIEKKEWVVYDHKFDLDDEEEFLKVACVCDDVIEINDRNMYTGLEISALDKKKYEEMIDKYKTYLFVKKDEFSTRNPDFSFSRGESKYSYRSPPFCDIRSIKRKDNLILTKESSKFTLSGDLNMAFDNILHVPKGVLKSSNILLLIIRYELIHIKPGSNCPRCYTRVDSIHNNMCQNSKCNGKTLYLSKLTFTREKRKSLPILPEIYIILSNIYSSDDEDEDEDDIYEITMIDNRVNASDFVKTENNDMTGSFYSIFNNFKEKGISAYYEYCKNSIDFSFTDTDVDK